MKEHKYIYVRGRVDLKINFHFDEKHMVRGRVDPKTNFHFDKKEYMNNTVAFC